MSISAYIKEIGRGKEGARSLGREQAADLMGQLLDGTVPDLAVGGFCLAMRIKGETPQEMAGFLDAAHTRLRPLVAATAAGEPTRPVVVLPSYNGARKLPVLTPLLALLLARQGWPVVVHGCATEDARVPADRVLAALGHRPHPTGAPVPPGTVAWVPTDDLHPGLRRLLDVRRTVGLRNPAHSLVKLMVPVQGPAVLVSSYTHPEYLVSMTDTLRLTGTTALLLRGTEGEPVADPRRQPALDAFHQGTCTRVVAAQTGTLATVPQLPPPDATATAHWTQQVLDGQMPVPTPLATQVLHIDQLARQLQNSGG